VLLERYPDHYKLRGRLQNIANIEKYGKPIFPNRGKNEDKILDKIEQEKNIILTRQYRVKGFFIDGYDEDNNVAYEVNEKYHYANEKQIEKDVYRRNIIEEELRCKFIIIDDI
jgi:very-short-patch-repair endonuclease